MSKDSGSSSRSFRIARASQKQLNSRHASHYRPGSDDRTLIPLNSPLARGLTKINGNASVTVSGHLFYVPDQDRTPSHIDPRRRYRGTTEIPAASVASPRYLAAFDRVELAQ